MAKSSPRTIRQVRAGDEFVAYPDSRRARQHHIRVTRVARDGSWADIVVSTWAVQWRKRQPLPMRFVAPLDGRFDFDAQEADHMAMLREKGIL